MPNAARNNRAPARPAALPGPVEWRAGGPVATLHDEITARLAGYAPPSGSLGHPASEGVVAALSRVAGPVTLAVAYAVAAVLIF